MFNNVYYSIVIIMFEANVKTDAIYPINKFFFVRSIRAIWDQPV